MDQVQRASLQHRMKRRQLWVSLWLTRLCGWLQFIRGDQRRAAWLDARTKHLARELEAIILCQATLRLKFKAAPRFQDARSAPRLNLRSVIGGELRHAFKAKTLEERLAKIRRALEQSEILIARLARRLRRGMSKLASAHTRVAIAEDVSVGPRFAGVLAALLVLRAASLCADSDTS